MTKDNLNNTIKDDKYNLLKHSKIVNDKGELIVCYHGSHSHFNSFNTNNCLTWFTDNKEYSKNFGDIRYKVYLNIERPLYLGDIDSLFESEDESEISNPENRVIISYNDCEREFIITNIVKEISKKLLTPIEKLTEIYLDNYVSGCVYDLTKTKEFYNIVEESGYDGVIASESGVNTYGVVNNSQIIYIDDNEQYKDCSIKDESHYYWRYLGVQELLSYLKGDNITRKQENVIGQTNAPQDVMFFLDDKIKVSAMSNGVKKTLTPIGAWKFLEGVCKAKYLVKFSSNEKLGKSIGMYADVINNNAKFFDTIQVAERYIKCYNNNTFKLEEIYEIRDDKFFLVDIASLLDDSFFEEDEKDD